jgi:ornithine decarboxylase
MKIYTTSLFGVNVALNNYNKFNKIRWIYDKPALLQQASKWAIQLPWIKPYYAVKSNPLPYLLSDLMQYKLFNIGLDISSRKETTIALTHTPLSNTIYTNPHTIPYEMRNCVFHLKVVDSICELELLHENNIKCPLLIRINSDIHDANIQFDSKFGANKEEIYDIIHLALKYNYVIKGVSFHIGSGGNFSRKDAFKQTIYKNAIPLLKYIQLFNKEKLILNMGGGLLYDTDLLNALGWTKELPYTMIAEPGRYFSEPSHHLAIQVIAKTSKGIFLDNGVYHELNCFHRDHWKMPLLTKRIYKEEVSPIYNYKCMNVFGPTCDSYDTIGEQYFPKDITVGDWILLPNMGAYTNAGSVDFNGIRAASSFTYV